MYTAKGSENHARWKRERADSAPAIVKVKVCNLGHLGSTISGIFENTLEGKIRSNLPK